jgi:NitT/TauT family transport system substrate-binding protein
LRVKRIVRLALALIVFTIWGLAPGYAQGITVVKIGMTPVETAGGVYYAEELGLFRKIGIQPQFVNLRGGAAIIAAVSGGDLDMGVANPLGFVNAFQRGIPIKAMISGSLYSPRSPQSLLVIAPDRPAPKASELNGKVFCGVAVKGMDELAVDAWMDKMGGQSSTIKFVELPPSAEPGALAEGRVDTCVLAEPVLSAEIAKNQVKAISKVYGIAYGERFTMAVFFGSSTWLDANPALAKKFIQAVSDAQVWATTHPREAAVMLAKYSKVQLPAVQMIVQKNMTDPTLLQPVIDVGAKYNFVARQMSASDMFWHAP